MSGFSYKNLISTFFVNNRLIAARKERIEKCLPFVVGKLRCPSVKSQEDLKNKISSVDVTFMKKWRESKCKDEESFRLQHEQWINTDLKVKIRIFYVETVHK